MKYDKKGFTVAELLIVCAIVGILVTISIPILNVQIEKAREAHDIATMRAAASAAIELYYAGVHDKKSAEKAGMNWNSGVSTGGYPKEYTANAYGNYDVKTGKIVKADPRPYGKGTTVDGGTVVASGNPNGAYCATADYRKAVVKVSIYPNLDTPKVDVYWKNVVDSSRPYVGGQSDLANIPNYSLRYELN